MAEPLKKRAKPAGHAAKAPAQPAQRSSSYFDDLMSDVQKTHSAMQAASSSSSAGGGANGGHSTRAAAAVPAGESRIAVVAAGLLASRQAALALGLDPQTALDELEVGRVDRA
jgi:hypothetical protein